MIEILKFYSHCRVPTQEEELQRKLGMDNEEFNYYVLFMNGFGDSWLMIT